MKVSKLAVALGAAGVAGCGALAWMAKESSYGPLQPSDEELIKDLPGGELIDQNELKMHAGRAVTINVPPSKVYPYLKQLGCHKAGFYSYDKLERLFGFHIYNDLTVEQKWQDTKVGDWIPYRQNGAGTGVVGMEENKYILTKSDSREAPSDLVGITWHPPGFDYIAWTWNFYTIGIDDDTKTRFIMINDVAWGDVKKFWFVIALLAYGVTGNVMSGRMLRVLKGCAEGTLRKAERQKARNAMRARKYNVGDPTWGNQ